MTGSFSFRTGGGGRKATVGLDIGSSAVRAVELAGGAAKRRLAACGQIGLPPGAVVDGEVREVAVVADALRRLWAGGGFSTRRVVVAVGGQRVIVREADVTAMSAEDFRSAMSFEVQDLIPIAVADAILDFQILGEAEPTEDGPQRMRVLLAAADREAVGKVLRVLEEANLQAVAVDVVPTALLRGAGIAALTEGTGMVSVGTHLTNVIFRSPTAFLSRTLAVGAEQMTEGVGLRLGVERADAEAVKRYAGSEMRGASRAAALVAEESRPLVEQVAESFDFFHGQRGSTQLEQVLLTGGGAQSAGLPDALAHALGAPVVFIDPLDDVDCSGVAIEAGDLARFRASAAVATGLAGWSAEPPGRRFSLLPPEIREQQRRQKILVGGVSALALLAVVLAGAGYLRHQQVSSVKGQITAAETENTALQKSAAALGAVPRYEAAVNARRTELAALATGIDWPTLVHELDAAVPAEFTITQLGLSSTAPATGAGTEATAGSTTASPMITMSVTAKGGSDTVATWLRTLATFAPLTDVVVPSSSTSTAAGHAATTTFSSSATVGPSAPKITYSWEVRK